MTGRISGERSSSGPKPRRGDVWWADLDPVRGHEQGGRRPAVVVSVDRLNRSRMDLVVICPLTRSGASTPQHVAIDPPEANLLHRSFVLVEQARSASIERLGARIGRVRPLTAAAIDDRLRRLFGLRAVAWDN
ncbi:MAG: type II toxin-antitoxin system PemK/MazF family toxin [Chloroflexi bacterium]|nr:MAG: type II toxin-antitoxin system PemK/MazF family toxin [Chloroflexota bacterium]